MIEFLLCAINCISYFIFFYVAFDKLRYDKTVSILITLLETIVCYFITVLMKDYYSMNQLLTDFFSIISTIIFNGLLFGDKKRTTICCLFLNSLSFAFLSIITVIMFSFIKEPISNYSILTLYNFVCLFVLYALANFIKGKTSLLTEAFLDDYIVALFFPTMLQYLIYDLYILYNLKIYIYLLSVTIFSNISLFILLYKKVIEKQRRQNEKMLGNLLDESFKQYNQLVESEKQVRNLRHDLKNHLLIIEMLNRNDDKDELSNYLNQIIETLEYDNTKIYCLNIYVNALINSKVNCNKNINFSIKINDDFFENFKDSDICSLISNLLDNAIYELNTNPCLKQEIELSMAKDGNFKRIYCSNEIKNIKDLKTNKSNKEEHGFGMNIIKGIVDKYNGEIMIEQNNKFEVFILFCFK